MTIATASFYAETWGYDLEVDGDAMRVYVYCGEHLLYSWELI